MTTNSSMIVNARGDERDTITPLTLLSAGGGPDSRARSAHYANTSHTRQPAYLGVRFSGNTGRGVLLSQRSTCRSGSS